MPRRRMTGAEEGNVELGADSTGGGPDAGGGRGAGMPRGKGSMPSPSPRLLSAESRLAQEKTWLKTLPIYCHAEPMRCSDFVWSFRVSGLDETPYEEIGKISFRAHFPRDYPRTPPTLLLTDELVHPNWKFPARGLEIPHLTKEGWNPSMTIPKMLLYLREIIQRPDISALGLLWREGSGPLVDGGASLGHAAPSLAAKATAKASSSAAASALAIDKAGAQHWTSLSRAASAPARDESGDVEGASAGGVRAGATGSTGGSAWTALGVSRGGTAATAMATAAGWTAARRDIDSELALLYLLDTGAFRNLVSRHQHHTGAISSTTTSTAPAPASATPGASEASTAKVPSLPPTGPGGGVSGGTNGVIGGSNGRASLDGGPGAVGGSGGAASGAGGGVPKSGARRIKSVGPLHGLGSFARKVTGGSSRGGSHSRRSGNVNNAESGLSDAGESSRSSSKGCSGSTGGCGELSVGKMAELRQQQQRRAAGDGTGFSALMISSPIPAPRQASLSRTGSWDPGDNGDQELDDSIPAAVNCKARKVLGLPQHRLNAGAAPDRSASSTSSSTTSSASSATSSSSTISSFSSPSDRSNPHQAHPPRPAAPQKPSSNLPPQPRRGRNGQRATLIQPPVASMTANELSNPSFQEGEGAPTTPPGKLSLIPFPTVSGPGPAAPKPVESEGKGQKGHATAPGSLVVPRGVSKERVSVAGVGRAGSGWMSGEQSGRGREMVVAKREEVSVARRGSKSLPRDGQSRAEARAARLEADKVAALRYFAAEDRREREATRSSRAGSDETLHYQHHEASPPSLPPAMLPPLEPSLHGGDSKAWRVLGSGPHKVERRKIIKVSPSKVRSSSLPPRRVPAEILNTTAEGDAGGGKGCVGGDGDRQLQSPPTRRGSRRRHRLHPPRPTPSGVGAIGSKKDPTVPALSSYNNGDGRPRKLPIPLLNVCIDDDDGDGQPELEELGPTAMTPRVAATPLSPGIQTPPAHPVVDITRLVASSPEYAHSPPRPRPLSPGAQTPPGDYVDPRVEREATLASTAVEVTTPRDFSRSRAKTMWANRSMEEAEAGAAEVFPPGWGFADEGSDRDQAERLHSAASTPRGKPGGAAGGGGGGKRGLRGVVNRTPGRLPRRLHQGVNKVKRAVGVGEFQPTSSQVGPVSGSVTPDTPKGKGSSFGSDGVRHVFLPSPARFRVRHRESTGGLGSARSSGSVSSNGSTGSSNISKKQPALPPRSGRTGSGGGGKVAAAGAATLAASGGGGGGGGGGLSKIGSAGVKGKSSIPVAADGAALSMREAHEKLEKLVKVLGPECRDEIWKALTKGAAPAASVAATATAEEASAPLESTGNGRSTSMSNSAAPVLNSPAVHGGGTRARRALSSSSSGGYEGCGGGPSPRERWVSDAHVGWGGGGGGGGTVVSGGGAKSAAKSSKFAYRKRLRESLDAAYKNRGMVFCLQEAVLYVRGKDPICPDHRPRWWPDPGADGKPYPQIRAPLVGAWYEGRRAGAASLVPWQMRWNLFGGAGWNSGRGVAEDSKVRADGTRVPAMMVVPLEAVRERLPYFEEGVAVPVSRVPRHAAVVWVSHCWMGTPSRPDDQDGSKAKAIYEGLKRLDHSEVYVWIDVSCLPSNVGPPAEKDKSSSLSRRQSVSHAEDVAASDSEEVREEMGQRARTIRALPLYLLCCDYFLAIDQREPAYMASPWARLERAALREAMALTAGGGATKASRNGHPRMLAMQREEMASFTSMNKRPTARIVQLSNLEVLPKLDPLPPFGQGSKAGASGISVADVPAMKRSFDLLKGLLMARRRLARYPFMDIPRLVPDEELGDEPIRAEGLVEDDFETTVLGGSDADTEREFFEGGDGRGIGYTGVLQGQRQGWTGRLEREEPEGTTEAHNAGVEVAAAEMVVVETDGEEAGVSAGLGAETGSLDMPGSRYRVERQPRGVSEEEEVTRGEGCRASIRGVSVNGIAAVGGSGGETEGDWISRDPRRCRRLEGALNPSDSSSARIQGGEDGTRLVGGGVGIALRHPRFGGGIAEMSPVAVNAAAVAAEAAQLSIIKRRVRSKSNGSCERTRAVTAAAVSEGLGVSADERTVEAITELTPVRRYGRRRNRRRRSRTWGTASEDDCAEPVAGIWSSSPSPQASVRGYGRVDGVAMVNGGSCVGGSNGIRGGGDGVGEGYDHDREGAVVVVEDERALGLDAGGAAGEVDFDGLPPLVTPTLREREMLVSEGETSGVETPRKGKWDQGRPPPISRPSCFGSRAVVTPGLPSPQGGGAGGGFSKGGGGFGGSGGGSRVTARPPPSPSGASSRGGGAPPRRATVDGGSGGGRSQSSNRSRVSRAGFVAGIGGRDVGGEHPKPCNFLDIRNAFEIQANKTAAAAVVSDSEIGVGVMYGAEDEGAPAHGFFDRTVPRLSDSSSQRSR